MWAAVVGEELVGRKRGNSHDIYAVSVMKDSVVVGHLSRKLSPVALLFLMKDAVSSLRKKMAASGMHVS